MARHTRTPTRTGCGCPANAGKAARWLGYLPFDQIVDQRNAAPVVQIFASRRPVAVHLRRRRRRRSRTPTTIQPSVSLDGFIGVQPYKLVIVGEKSSLDDVSSPRSPSSYGADLYLPTGEHVRHDDPPMAKIGAEDGRPMVVLYFSDCDPAGWQMPVAVARKLQAFKAL